MVTDESLWLRHQVSGAGLSFDIYRPWQLESIIEADKGNIYQTITDTEGIVFLRYGKEETIEEFLPTFRDFVTTTSIISDETQTYYGQPARRLTFISIRQSLGVYRDDPDLGLTHEISAEKRSIVNVIGFQVRDIPVLVGYQLPEEMLAAYESILDRILNSVSIE